MIANFFICYDVDKIIGTNTLTSTSYNFLFDTRAPDNAWYSFENPVTSGGHTG